MLPASSDWSAPGSLLLFGEYFILDTGGQGLAIGGGPRALARFKPSNTGGVEVAMQSHGAGTSHSLPHLEACLDQPSPETALLAACVLALNSRLDEEALSRLWAARGSLQLHSDAFFDGPRKLGFGSSAAVCVALCACLLSIAFPDRPPGRQAVFELALAAHRQLQGGHGSGYDVAASCFGGLGVFTAGRSPTWLPAPAPIAAAFSGPGYYSGAQAQRTESAITAYTNFKQAHPALADSQAAKHAQAFAELLAADQEASMLRLAGWLRDIAAELGRDIGVPADIAAPPASATFFKASGAGSELGFFLPGTEPRFLPSAGLRSEQLA